MPAVEVGSAIYLLGGLGNGGDKGHLFDAERIETRSPKPVVTTLKAPLLPRFFHSAEAEGPFIYLFGGQAREDGETVVTSVVERLDTRDLSVKRMAPMPIGVRTPASAIVGGKIYLAGGSDEFGDRLDTLFIYDIASNTWTSGAPMSQKKECDLLLFQGKLLAVGGFDGQVAVTNVQIYDIAANTWSDLPPLPIKTSAHHGAVAGENVVLFGDYEDFGRVQSGNPLLGNWKRIEGLRFVPRRHSAVIAMGQNIYVIGGNTNSSGPFFNDIQVFKIEDFTP